MLESVLASHVKQINRRLKMNANVQRLNFTTVRFIIMGDGTISEFNRFQGNLSSHWYLAKMSRKILEYITLWI